MIYGIEIDYAVTTAQQMTQMSEMEMFDEYILTEKYLFKYTRQEFMSKLNDGMIDNTLYWFETDLEKKDIKDIKDNWFIKGIAREINAYGLEEYVNIIAENSKYVFVDYKLDNEDGRIDMETLSQIVGMCCFDTHIDFTQVDVFLKPDKIRVRYKINVYE